MNLNNEKIYISNESIVSNNATIYPNVFIEGKSIIEDNVTIYPFTLIKNSTIKKGTIIYSSHIFSSIIGENNTIGPYANIRENTITNNNNKIGSFVETKDIQLNNNSKIPHLSYIGNSIIGNNVNIGAGCITANYDGKNKHKTIIHNDVFIGSNTTLIAPVTIEKNSLVAAGSTINKNVLENSLAIARCKQTNKLDYKKSS